jgi:hypothetical protein
MTVADAKAVLGDQASESTDRANPSARLTESLVMNNLMVGDVSCRGNIYSKKGSDAVVSVTIRAGQAQDPAFLRGVSYDSLKSLLIEKYGSPKSDDRRVEGRDTNTIVTWTFPSTLITLRRSEDTYGYGSVLINYAAVDKKALDIL